MPRRFQALAALLVTAALGLACDSTSYENEGILCVGQLSRAGSTVHPLALDLDGPVRENEAFGVAVIVDTCGSFCDDVAGSCSAEVLGNVIEVRSSVTVTAAAAAACEATCAIHTVECRVNGLPAGGPVNPADPDGPQIPVTYTVQQGDEEVAITIPYPAITAAAQLNLRGCSQPDLPWLRATP